MKEGTYENEEQIFMSAFIPQNLFEVIHIERDITEMKLGNVEEIFYSALTGIDIAMKQAEEELGMNEDEEEEEFEKSGGLSRVMRIRLQ